MAARKETPAQARKKSAATAPAVRPPPRTEPLASIAASSADEMGVVRHYFPRVEAAIIEVTRGTLQAGDTLHFRGHTTDFYQQVDRLEVDHQPIEVARAGQAVGVHVSRRVREGDVVMRIG